ncbi:hypothetical protein [Sphaerothrix gracilis]|uniref:hypothetical protein n=1 Tax=Sphaerothrix gracilis TaxID=3151835 RepID=UPI0031FC0D1F
MQCSKCGHRPVYRHGKAKLRRQYFCPACQSTFTRPLLLSRRGLAALGAGGITALGVFGFLFVTERITLAGVPASVIFTFLQDDVARQAYFRGHNALLHDRLVQLGIEPRMKAFYADRIADEQALDLHIHQILYDRTGYIGEAYRVEPASNELVLKDPSLVPTHAD